MAKIHLLHVKSCKPTQVGGSEPKLPTAEQIEYGELAINYGKGYETLSIRNSEDEIFPFNMRQALAVQDTYLSGVSVNEISGEVVDHVASVSISGSDVNVGDYTSVDYDPTFSGAVNVSGEQTVAEAFNAVETTISSLVDEVLDNELVTEKAIHALGHAAGTITEGNIIEYIVHDSANYINNAKSLDDATLILDGVVNDLANEISDKIDNINVNGISGIVADGIASVSISGQNVTIGGENGGYVPTEYPAIISASPTVASGDTVSQSFKTVETTISDLANIITDDERVISQSIIAIGRAGGIVDPSTNQIVYVRNDNATYIDMATSLADADNILDDAIKRLSASTSGAVKNIVVNDVQGTVANGIASVSIDGNDAEVGSYTAITYPNIISGVPTVSSGDTLAEALNNVETAISGLAEYVENQVEEYEPNTSATYISSATSLQDADNILDAAISSLSAETSGCVKNIVVNNMQGTVTNGVASVSVATDNINVSACTAVTYPSIISGAPHVENGDSVSQAFNDIETAISGLAYYVENHVDEYEPNTADTYIATATSLQNADDILDAALADLSGKSLTNVSVNGVSGTVTNNEQAIVIDGFDIEVGADYSATTYPTAFSSATPVSATDTISEALSSIEKTISALTEEVLRDEKVLEKGFEKVAASAGILKNDGSIAYVTNTSAHYINVASSLTDADNILDTTLYSSLDTLQSQITTLANALSALEARVRALEQQ